MFHRPARTPRLAVVAAVSLAMFAAVSAAELRSFWRWDGWISANGRWIAQLADGCAIYNSKSGGTELPAQHPQRGHLHAQVTPDSTSFEKGLWGFIAHSQTAQTKAGKVTVFLLRLPVWPLLLLLLIIPAGWLYARPAGRAFPVVTESEAKDGEGSVPEAQNSRLSLPNFMKFLRARLCLGKNLAPGLQT